MSKPKGIEEEVIKIIEKILPNKNINLDLFNHHIRKAAHFFSYMVLGMLIMNVLKMMKIKGIKRIALALVICVLCVILDRFHQLVILENIQD